MASLAARGSAIRVLLVLLAAAALAAGCATVPSGGTPQPVRPGGGQAEAYVQPLPPPGPAAHWSANQVVLGFLHASASYATDPQAARRYLSPSLSRKWQPGPVTVVSSLNKPTTLPYHPQVAEQPAAGQDESVEFTGQRLATLSPAGQYQYSPGTSTYQFILTQVKGVWLISALPLGDQSLLLTQADFEEVFQPRNLFFYGPSESWAVNGDLVPDPVYAPLQSSNTALDTNLAAGLVRALISDRGSWLSGATTTAFPRGTTLLGVTISGQTASVDLGGAASHASTTQIDAMEAQILATLGSKAYAAPLALNVEVKINGKVPYQGLNQNLVFEVSSGQLVAQTAPDTVGPVGSQTNLLPGLADSAIVSATAAAPGNVAADLSPVIGQNASSVVAAAVSTGGGCTVYAPAPGANTRYRDYQLSTSGGPCTSLSWDRNGVLWAVAGRHVWAVRTLSGQVVQVGGVAGVLSDRPGVQLLSVEMAPDAVRAALLIRTPSGNRMALTAITSQRGAVAFGPPLVIGTGLANPVAISWSSPFDLVALTSAGIWQVPLTGGIGKQLGPVPRGSATLATDGRELAVGTTGGEIFTSANSGLTWTAAGGGTFPEYAG